MTRIFSADRSRTLATLRLIVSVSTIIVVAFLSRITRIAINVLILRYCPYAIYFQYGLSG